VNTLKKISLIFASFFIVTLSFADQSINSSKVAFQANNQNHSISVLIDDDLDDAQNIEEISGFHPLYFIQSTIPDVNVQRCSFIAANQFALSSVPSYIKSQNLRI
jgi:hypothetical protein